MTLPRWFVPKKLFDPCGGSNAYPRVRKLVSDDTIPEIGLSAEAKKELDWLRARTKVDSSVDVVRNALRLYAYAVKQADCGHSLCIVDKDDNIVERDIIKK